ncbi:MAG: YggS family pyridoxal phosphate-dependent enzyme [Verrucomicrobiota bacterium]
MSTIAANFAEVRQRLAQAAQRSGRDPQEIELCAVSKTWPALILHEAVDCGQRLFGENKVQEAEAKQPELPGHCRWHFLGHLQKNKVKKALPLFECFHGVDSLELAERFNRLAGELGLHPEIYLQVNLADEASKFGFSPAGLRAVFESILEMDRLYLQGLMVIPPPVETPEEQRPRFAQTRELRDALVSEFGVPLPKLSMGMSGDFEIAIEEGATLVRVGTTLFGQRNYSQHRREAG